MDRYREDPEIRCSGCGEWHERIELVNGFCFECLDSEQEEIQMAIDQAIMSQKYKKLLGGDY